MDVKDWGGSRRAGTFLKLRCNPTPNSPLQRCRYVPEAALHLYGTPRPLFMVLLGALSSAASVLAAYASLGGLYGASVISGIAFGANPRLWCITWTTTSCNFMKPKVCVSVLYCALHNYCGTEFNRTHVPTFLPEGCIVTARSWRSSSLSGLCIPMQRFFVSFFISAASITDEGAACTVHVQYPSCLSPGDPGRCWGAGAHWSLMPALASEIFGLEHLAGNYAMLSVSILLPPSPHPSIPPTHPPSPHAQPHTHNAFPHTVGHASQTWEHRWHTVSGQ